MTSSTRLEGACITREQFLLRETRIVAGMRLDGLANEEIVTRTVDENLFQYPTTRMIRNIAGVCTKRLDALGSDALVRVIATGEPEAAAQANLYAMMRTYPLVRCHRNDAFARTDAQGLQSHGEGMGETVSDGLSSHDEGINEGINEGISSRASLSRDERAVVRLMQLNPRVTYSDISEVTGFSESKTYRVIQVLRERGTVERVGARKNGTWKVVSDG